MTLLKHNNCEEYLVDNSFMCQLSPYFKSKFYNHNEANIEDSFSEESFSAFIDLCEGRSAVINENIKTEIMKIGREWGVNFDKALTFSTPVPSDLPGILQECK